MVKIDDLIGIPKNRRNKAIKCLNELLVFKNNDGILSPIITGYNWYTEVPQMNSVITFSHIHDSESYKKDMLDALNSLGYDIKKISDYIRTKGGAFLHDFEFNIRQSDGSLPTALRIRNIKNGEYLDLNKYSSPLEHYPELNGLEGWLIAENRGWELDMPFSTKSELFIITSLFLKKSGSHIYDKDGNVIIETDEAELMRKPWTDAYAVPVLLLDSTALQYAKELTDFTPATKIALKENDNEISFIIHEKIQLLKDLSYYNELLQLDFSEEPCLGNKPFVTRYVDKKR